MTRETKIGLLVGLAFIIVIGILLSDHFRGAQEPPPATLDRAGAVVRQTVTAPGSNQSTSPITLAPEHVTPTGAVPTPKDMETQVPPVVMKTGDATGPLAAGDPLGQAARAQGEELVSANPGELPTPTGPAMGIAVSGATGATPARTYKALAGDSVSKMASRFLGANTARNRQAIIQANPSLAANPNKVVAGQVYNIPSAAGKSQPGSVATLAGATSAAASGAYVYVVKEGDTLWGIATGQLGKPGAVEAIKALNQDLLHGSNSLKPGMKLRLPSQPVAIAD